MKKRGLIVSVAALLVLALSVFAFGCGGVQGKYKHEMTKEDIGMDLGGVKIVSVVELGKDGKGTISVEVSGEVPTELKEVVDAMSATKTEFTYTVDGEKITMKVGSSEQEGTIKGNELTIDEIVYKK